MAKLLEVEDIRKSFGSTEVLKGVSLSLDRGETKVIMGSSGTGKSTLLRCVNRLDPADSGHVRLDGEEVTDANVNRMRQRIAFVFQDFNLFLHLSARDNITIGLRKLRKMSKADARQRADRELDRVGLSDRADNYPSQLSGGQQQRVSIARALAMDPDVLLFDEPTSALDPELTGEVVSVMQSLARDGMTMLVVSHEVGFARRAADAVIFMDGGHVLEEAPPKEFFSAPKHDRARQFLTAIGEGEAA
ncbi:amino acid ABC transporter ATP-binding protein [Roseivivax sediminis]|uniref:Amino acid ABC transporter ATP-binding protein, PAAT family n=1 Tax=Roseivivax sediminis TaxID=936889 RepID=A0A1I1X913_9RHOB|nr:amino acid ABC transporter ATP-binding protein [Roseivivax sediminis]SFE03879.1 amino acid ABC transporter ATP-binding protein, PAAT family [Roseivivax sediminis]